MNRIFFAHWAGARGAAFPARTLLHGLALTALLGLLAGCAIPSASPPSSSSDAAATATAAVPASATVSGVASERAALADYEAITRKLHSPRLVAEQLFRQAQAKHSSGHAIMAALLALRAGDAETATAAAAWLRKQAPQESATWSVSLRTALSRANLELAREAAAKAYALGGAKAVALGVGGEADPWFVYPLVADLAKKHPQDHALQLLLARSALAADDMTAALAAARKAGSFGPGARAAELIAIQARWNLGQQKAALADAAKALAAHPHDIGLRAFYANMLASAGKIRQARETLADARALDPDNPRVAFGYAMLAANTGDTATARARLAAILQADHDTPGAYTLLGHLAAGENDWGQAFGWYQLDQAPDDLASSRVNSLFALYHWKGYAQANDYLSQLELRFPGLAPTWAGVDASLLDMSGQSEAAWEALGKALARYPQVRPLRYQRALLADKLGKSGNALAALKRLVREEPGNPLYLNAYGYTLVEHTDRYRDAYGYIKRALVVSPDEGAILDSMGWVLYRMGRPEKALGYLNRAWKQTDDPTVAFHLATVYLALNRRNEAGKVLHTALGKSPKDAKLLRLERKLARR